MSTEPQQDRSRAPAGFSLVEVVIALVILAVGLLAMAATTVHLSRQIRLADVRTERMAAVQSVAEQVRAQPFTDLFCYNSDAVTVGEFTVTWEVAACPSGGLRRIKLMSDGPGYKAGEGWSASVEETTYLTVARFQ